MDRILTPEQAHLARKGAYNELYWALRGLIAEFEKFSRYGSPMAMAANDAMNTAKRAIAKADGQ